MFNPLFLKGETWGLPGTNVEHLETHAAHVFLVGAHAYKIKKDVKLPYLDFSSIEKRRAVIAKELAINRVFAPGIYVTVIDKLGEPVLVMNRFAAKALLSWQVAHGGISPGMARALAAMAAQAHHQAPRRATPGFAVMTGLGGQLSQAFTGSPDLFRAAETLEFHALYEDALARLKTLLNRRGKEGLVRRCHGDMHCGNIAVIDNQPVLFDAIEFSEKIATGDVLYDLAFLLMDLLRHGEALAANILFNHYLHLRRDAEDLSGLAALPMFLSTRAGVRALVTADLVHELTVEASLKPRGDALDYFRASLAFLKPPKPTLTCVGGLSGTGKSTLGAALAPHIGPTPGGLHIRSDIERKVLARVEETVQLPASHYSRAESAKVYQAAFFRAEQALRAGHSVVLDAVFALESERNIAESIARKTGARFTGIWLDGDPALLKSRLLARRSDASDANAEVIDIQLGYDIGPMTWTRIEAAGPPAAILDRVTRMLPYPPAARA